MLPAQYRMTRSEDFGATVSRGVRAGRSSLVVHSLRSDGSGDAPKVGFVVSKAVGNAVLRHRVSRRLRHVAAHVIAELAPGDRVVVRALPRSASASSGELHRELTAALRSASRRART